MQKKMFPKRKRKSLSAIVRFRQSIKPDKIKPKSTKPIGYSGVNYSPVASFPVGFPRTVPFKRLGSIKTGFPNIKETLTHQQILTNRREEILRELENIEEILRELANIEEELGLPQSVPPENRWEAE